MHGRYGKPCPDCGSPVQRIVYAENEANYCATCQTGGRLLADRALSQLLQGRLAEDARGARGAQAAGPVKTPGATGARARRIGLAISSAPRSPRRSRRTAASTSRPGRSRSSRSSPGSGIPSRVNRGRTEEQLLLLQPQAGFPARAAVSSGSVEGHFAKYFRPDGYAAGLVPFSARYFFGTGPVAPYVEARRRLLLDEPRDRGARPALQLHPAGRPRSPRPASRPGWMVEARWLHYSNAGTVLPNLGFNAVVVLGGWRFR